MVEELAEGEWRLFEYPFVGDQMQVVMLGVEVEEGRKGLRILYPNGSAHPPSFIDLRRPIAEILDQRFGCIRFDTFRVHNVTLPRGCGYPRVWRNGPIAEFEPFTPPPSWAEMLEAERGATFGLRRLLRDLDRVFDVIEPTASSMDVHGHLLRDLLLRACTEVEAAWKGILRANGRTGDRMTTNTPLVHRVQRRQARPRGRVQTSEPPTYARRDRCCIRDALRAVWLARRQWDDGRPRDRGMASLGTPRALLSGVTAIRELAGASLRQNVPLAARVRSRMGVQGELFRFPLDLMSQRSLVRRSQNVPRTPAAGRIGRLVVGVRFV